jgi:hypothetical protein
MAQERGNLEESLARLGLRDEVELRVDDGRLGDASPSVMRVLRIASLLAILVTALFVFHKLEQSGRYGVWIAIGGLFVGSIVVEQWQKARIQALIAKTQKHAGPFPTRRRICMKGSSTMIARVLDHLSEYRSPQSQRALPESEPLRAKLHVIANEGLHARLSFAASRSTWAGVLVNICIVIGLLVCLSWLSSKVFIDFDSSVATIVLVLTVILFPWQINIFIRRVLTLSHGALVRTDEVRTLASTLLGTTLANKLFAPPFAPICVDLQASPITIDLRAGWAQLEGRSAATSVTATFVAGSKFVHRREQEALTWARLLHAACHIDRKVADDPIEGS